jgi:hypothetical protein
VPLWAASVIDRKEVVMGDGDASEARSGRRRDSRGDVAFPAGRAIQVCATELERKRTMTELRAWATSWLDRLVLQGLPPGVASANLLLHDDLWHGLNPDQVEANLRRLRTPSPEHPRDGRCAVAFERPWNGRRAIWIEAVGYSGGAEIDRAVFARPADGRVPAQLVSSGAARAAVLAGAGTPPPARRASVPGHGVAAPAVGSGGASPTTSQPTTSQPPFPPEFPPVQVPGMAQPPVVESLSRPPRSIRATFWWSFFLGPWWFIGAIRDRNRAAARGDDGGRYIGAWLKGWAANVIVGVSLSLATWMVVGWVLGTAVNGIGDRLGTTATNSPSSAADTSSSSPSDPPTENDSSAAGNTTSAPTTAEAPRVTAAYASCTAAGSKDPAGTPTSYEAGRAVDGQADTAWRCDGDGVGQSIQLDLARPSTITGVGIVPGYAKTDPSDATDRYRQNRRISSVRYEFDNGTSIDQRLDTSPGSRQMQSIPIGPVVTSHVRVVILGSDPGGPSATQPAAEKIAVSEISLS